MSIGQHAGSYFQEHSMEVGSYITGFVDGEGSFLVSFSRRSAMVCGIEVRPSFTVSQHERSKDILSILQNFFGCGSVRFNRRDRTWKYEVRSLDNLIKRIIPHFTAYPLQTSKRSDFEQFTQVCLWMEQKKHLRPEGLKQIIRSAYRMNNFGARRYVKQDLLMSVNKMKV